MPAALRGVFAEEPLYLDLRWARDDLHVNLQHARFRSGWFQQDKGFPPESRDSAGGRDPHNLLVRQAKPGDSLAVEIQIGFDVVGNGTSTKRGVEVVYQYEGETKRFVIPSHLTVCAPASAKCAPAYS